MFDWFNDPQAWVSLFTLTVLEIVLGVDNIIFISILAGKLPQEQQNKARNLGLMLALFTRIGLLCSIVWLTKMTHPLFPIPFLHEHGTQEVLQMNGKRLVLLLGGLFLIWKSVKEIHGNLEGEDHEGSSKVKAVFASVLTQIVLVDIVFSLDSVITAVGMADKIGVMIGAVVIAMGVMLFAAKSISDFVNNRPTVKMLALAFLLMVGLVLVGEGCGQHIEKGYVYTAMAFAFGVEMLNMKAKKKKGVKPVDLRSQY